MRRQAVAVGQLDKSDGLDGLTSKQQLFVSACMSGLNDTQAYRSVYDTLGMTEGSIRAAAHVVRHDANVTLKLRELQDRRDAQTTLSTRLTREWITDKLMDLATTADKDSVRVTSLIALGKVVGIDLFRETTRVERVERSAEDIDRELREHLTRLSPMIEGKANVTAEPEAADRRRKPRA